MKLGSKHYLIEYCLFEYLIDSYIYVNNKNTSSRLVQQDPDKRQLSR